MYRSIAVLSLGLAAAPVAGLGQAQGGSPAGATTQQQPASDTAHAEQATKEQADKLFDLLYMRGTPGKNFEAAVREMGEKEIKDAPPESKKLLDGFVEKAMKMINISTDDGRTSKIEENLRRSLSREDADAAIAYLGTPAGQHMVTSVRQLGEDLKARRTQNTDELYDLFAKFKKDVASLKESSGHAQPAAAPVASLGQAHGGSPTGATTQQQPASDTAHAEQATKEQMVRILDLLFLREIPENEQMFLDALMEKGKNIYNSALQDSNYAPSQRAQADKLLQQYLEEMKKTFPNRDAVANSIGSYQKLLSSKDADAAIVFYSSPAGRHVLTAEPNLEPERFAPLTRGTDAYVKDLTAKLQKYLSRKDVDAAVAYYGSPAGQHMLDVEFKVGEDLIEPNWLHAQKIIELLQKLKKDLAALKQSSGQAQSEPK